MATKTPPKAPSAATNRPAPTPKVNATPDLSLSQDDINNIIAKHGYLSWAINDPELAPILKNADNLSDAELMAQIEGTNAWKTKAQSEREWLSLKASDPATASQRLTQQELQVRLEASRLGVPLADDRVNSIAEDSIRFGWSGDQLHQSLVNEAQMGQVTGGTGGGDLAANYRKVQQSAQNWMVPVSNDTAFKFSQQLADGQMDEQGVDTFFANMAKGKFPSLSQYIDKGVTPTQYFSPMREEMARLLERSPDSIDMVNDSKFSKVTGIPDGDGGTRPMTFAEASNYARTLPEWRTTKNANDDADALADKLSQTFGATAR